MPTIRTTRGPDQTGGRAARVPLETAAAGVLLAWDNYVDHDGDQREVVVALGVLRRALPSRLVERVDQVIAQRAGSEE